MKKALMTLVLLALALPAFAATATDVPVRVDPAFQEDRPAISSSHYAWDASKGERTDRVSVYVQPTGGQPTKVNAPKSDAFMGSLDGTRLAFEEHAPRGTDGDIRLIDLSTGADVPLPAGVNTPKEEWTPSIDGDYIQFLRVRFGRKAVRTAVWLVRLSTGETRQLATSKHREFPLLGPGHINGNFATWFRCGGKPESPCNAFRYDVTTGTTTQIPNPNGVFQGFPAPASDGDVYFSQSGFACGRNAFLMKWESSTGAVTTVFDYPPKVDSISNFVYEPGGSAPREIHYVKLSCSKERTTGDLYKIVE